MKKASKPDIIAELRQFLRDYPADSYLVALSGGLDSQVLLHALLQLQASGLPLTLRAIHINHGLQSTSTQWAQDCRAVCAEWGVALQVVDLQLSPAPGSSIEAVARAARYQAFAEALGRDEILLTAHHQDDQAETLLLNLLRGAGAAGLAAMPLSRRFQHASLCRPLLRIARHQLVNYAQAQQLQWIEDPSNQSTAFDRNYLRHEILPRLQRRWPALGVTLARVAQWQGENQAVLSGLLQQQLAVLAGTQPGTLTVSGLLDCDPALQKALLREWLRVRGFSMPSAVKLAHIGRDVLRAKADAKPCVRWADCEVRRYRNDVYALPPLVEHDPGQVYAWRDRTQPLLIPALQLHLAPELLIAVGGRLAASADELTVRFRCGGEQLLLPSGQHASLKKFMQAKGIPPWQRARIPLICVGPTIVLIPGLFTLQN